MSSVNDKMATIRWMVFVNINVPHGFYGSIKLEFFETEIGM